MTTTSSPTAPTRPAADSGAGPVTGRHLRIRRIDIARNLVTERLTGSPAWVLAIQLFIGLGWLRAATEKMIDPTWLSGEYLTSFLAEHEPLTVGWYRPFLDAFVAPNIWLVSAIVLVLQLGAGVSLVSGRFVHAGLAAGMFLNLQFVAAGAVDPSVFYLLSQGAVALWLFDRSRTPERRLWLWVAAVAGGTLAVISAPFISTLHPAEVIHDPALMLVTGGLLTLLCCEVAHRQASNNQGLP